MAAPAHAAFPGQNGRIVYIDAPSTFHQESPIFTMNPDGSDQTRLGTGTADDWWGYPHYSADGKKIVFASNRDGNLSIYVMNADGTGETRLTNEPVGDRGDRYASFSPDGTKIVFTRNGNLYTMNADGSNQTALTDTGGDYAPIFSPDGTKIVFNTYRDGNSEIYMMNPDGSNPVNLTNDPYDDYDPSFSPDGKKIAFTSARDGGIWSHVYIMNADGSNQTQLTFEQVSHEDYGADPEFSPDGTKIVYTRKQNPDLELFSMNVDGSAQTNLTNTPVSDEEQSASWQPIPIPPITSEPPPSTPEPPPSTPEPPPSSVVPATVFPATPTATSSPASALTATSVTLNGQVDAGGVAGAWQFQFGTSTGYNKGTPLQTIGAGRRSFAVSWLVNRLTPDTTYHFRVVLITGAGTTVSPFVKTYGRDLTFTTTHIGSLVLVSSRLSVRGGGVFVTLRCASRLSCRGRFSITTRARLAGARGLATIDCTRPNTTFFRIKPRATRTVRSAVSRSCVSLLRRSSHDRHSAKFSSRPRTAQQGIIRRVVLIVRG